MGKETYLTYQPMPVRWWPEWVGLFLALGIPAAIRRNSELFFLALPKAI